MWKFNLSEIDEYFMNLAIKEAKRAFQKKEVPVGAIIVLDNKIIAKTHNMVESNFDPTAHAEILAIRKATKKIKNWRLTGATLYVTKEPCVMCAGAMVNSRLSRLVYGCRDEKKGAAQSIYHILSDNRLNHQVEIFSGVKEEECAGLLKDFFQTLR
jgi:tRNA(adenine34) deaminase